MNLNIILFLCVISFVVGLLNKNSWRKYSVFILNIILILFLQPNLAIRNLQFWLPSVILILTIISWVIIRNSEKYKLLSIVKPIGLIITTYLILFFLINIGVLEKLFNPIQLQNLLLFGGLLALSIGLSLLKEKELKTTPWMILIISIFVLLKTPQLTTLVSKGLRILTHQSLDLARNTDISWFGFSYIAFRIIHTLRDHESGRLPEVDLIEYINYVTFFPTLTAGPIDRIEHFQKSFNATDISLNDRLILGGKRIIIGLFKKFVIADLLSIIAINEMNVTQIHNAFWMWISVYAYAFLIYFDFSGYTDIAIGMAQLMRIEIPENFTSPYLKKNLTLFWNSWHITLTQFFRSYFFNPVTRYLRTGTRKWSVWLIILFTQISTMILIGLWHGIILNFITWGLWHGIGLFVQNRWSNLVGPRIEPNSSNKNQAYLLNGAGIFLTFNFVSLGWVFFALPRLDLSITTFRVLIGAG